MNDMLLFEAATVMQRLARLPHSKTVMGSSSGPSVSSMHALPVSATRCGFLLQSKDMQVELVTLHCL